MCYYLQSCSPKDSAPEKSKLLKKKPLRNLENFLQLLLNSITQAFISTTESLTANN